MIELDIKKKKIIVTIKKKKYELKFDNIEQMEETTITIIMMFFDKARKKCKK